MLLLCGAMKQRQQADLAKALELERVRGEPKFARALLDEAATLFLNGEPEAARLLLRDLVNATMGFEALAGMTDTPAKSLRRMLSAAAEIQVWTTWPLFSTRLVTD